MDSISGWNNEFFSIFLFLQYFSQQDIYKEKRNVVDIYVFKMNVTTNPLTFKSSSNKNTFNDNFISFV